MVGKNGNIYDFSDFRLIPDEGRLLKNGIPIQLTPKAFELLVFLVENKGRLVTKSDFIDEFWKDAIVEEAAISRCIWTIRTALGDDPRRHVFVETVPKRGYRFVADVTESLTSESDTLITVPPRPFGLRRMVLVTVLAALTLVGAINYLFVLEIPGGSANTVAAERGTPNDDAYRLFIQGMYAYEKRTPEDARRAVELFEQATQLDHSFARAWAAKARALRYSAIMNNRGDISSEIKGSFAAIDHALSVDPELSEGYSARCELLAFYEFDFSSAEEACRRAVQLKPDSAIARVINARFLSSRGRHAEALDQIKVAIDLQPGSVYYQRNLGVSLFYSRSYDDAAKHLTRVLEMEKGFDSSIPWLVSTLAMQGRLDEAFKWSMEWQARRLSDEHLSLLRKSYAESGWVGFVNQQLMVQEAGPRLNFAVACQYALVGNFDRAFELLEKSLARREWGIAFLEVDPRLDSLRADPRFADLLARSRKRD